jgi:hypothetical protein
MLLIVRVSTKPVGSNTEMVGAFAVVVGSPSTESTVTVVVVAALMRPERRDPLLTGSAIEITTPRAQHNAAFNADGKSHSFR